MDRVTFTVNGETCSVGCEVSSEVTLLDFIRNTLHLRGTKYMCREGGCGACIVSVTKKPSERVEAVNSCLVSVTSCQGWAISTVEHLGNRVQGYHPLQTTLTDENGTQCGYCTPGWIMAMYSLLQSNQVDTMLEIEKSLGSNTCRCTGIRPILTAFKKFAKDAPKTNLVDIEDLKICKHNPEVTCNRNDCDDDDWCFVSNEDIEEIKINLADGRKWYRVCKISTVFQILNMEGYESYMLVFGNTAKGAYPIDRYPRILIDISGVEELKIYLFDQNLIVGAGTTISDLINLFKVLSTKEYFGYLEKIAEHLELVAHIPVRNLGSIAGNLMIKHQHNEFPSDLFLLFECVGAQLRIRNNFGDQIRTMHEFLQEDMKGKVIISVLFPPLSNLYKLVTFKIKPRSQNAIAIVNAAFLYNYDTDNVVRYCRIVFGGLSPNFYRSMNTEKYLIGKNLFINETLQSALKIMETELQVDLIPPQTSIEYRKQLALALFYKGLLSLCPPNILQPEYRSAVGVLPSSRPVSKGVQTFETHPGMYPVTQAVHKVEALSQCSGEAKYSEDIPTLPNEVFAEFVISTVAKGKLLSIHPEEALKQPGVIAFYSVKDIPGKNSFITLDGLLYTKDEVILCDGNVEYYNQPIGIIVAKTRREAEIAAKLVTAKYSDVITPVIDIKDAKEINERVTLFQSVSATDKGNDVAEVIKGNHTIYSQYHFMYENLVCVTIPTELGLEMYTAAQSLDFVQAATALALNVPQNKLIVNVRRVGGAYGIKVSRNVQLAIACSLVALKLNKPCRFIQPLSNTMKTVGKKFPSSADFEIAVDKQGTIQFINYNLYEDNGYIVDESLTSFAVRVIGNCYNKSRWNTNFYNVITDLPSNTWFRSPGTSEAICMAEFFMERIAYSLSLDPVEVRLANLDPNYNDLKEMANNLLNNSQFNDRKAAVASFNKVNRWKKRGLRFCWMQWESSSPQYYDVDLSVYHVDGTVTIVHPGIEYGQGVNTKVIQTCAYFLNIPIEKINTAVPNTVTTPNNSPTTGSISSFGICRGLQKCCDELLQRLEPIRNKLDNPTWEELIDAAFKANVDLKVHGYLNTPTDEYSDLKYTVYGVVCAEVEIDVLTGETQVLRVDLLQDAGNSLSPAIDIGQVEGAFIMGLGYWLTEQLVYDKVTGDILTNRSWNYWVPQALDIPQDFRVHLRKRSYSTPVVLGSKATGEPSLCLAVCIPIAIREAITSARLDSGIPTSTWFDIDGPYTVEKICLACATRTSQFNYN